MPTELDLVVLPREESIKYLLIYLLAPGILLIVYMCHSHGAVRLNNHWARGVKWRREMNCLDLQAAGWQGWLHKNWTIQNQKSADGHPQLRILYFIVILWRGRKEQPWDIEDDFSGGSRCGQIEFPWRRTSSAPRAKTPVCCYGSQSKLREKMSPKFYTNSHYIIFLGKCTYRMIYCLLHFHFWTRFI